MSDNLKALLASFKTPDELKAYIEAQQTSFIDVSKKLRKLEQENEDLHKKIKEYKNNSQNSSNLVLKSDDVSNSELICLKQIQELKTLSEERVLTLEESKKLEIFHKILGQIALSKKNKDDKLAEASDEELFAIINGGKSDVK